MAYLWQSCQVVHEEPGSYHTKRYSAISYADCITTLAQEELCTNGLGKQGPLKCNLGPSNIWLSEMQDFPMSSSFRPRRRGSLKSKRCVDVRPDLIESAVPVHTDRPNRHGDDGPMSLVTVSVARLFADYINQDKARLTTSG